MDLVITNRRYYSSLKQPENCNMLSALFKVNKPIQKQTLEPKTSRNYAIKIKEPVS